MFFRPKETRLGQVLKLIESYRDETLTPRHRTVASLGDALIKLSSWKSIAKTVEDRLYGREDLIARDFTDTEHR